MNLRTKLVAMFAALTASKHAIGTSVLTAAAAASMTSDWVTWAISGAGAVAYRLKTPETKKSVAIGNAIVSVFLGGLGAPYLVAVIVAREWPQPPVYLCAFILALVWPFVWDKTIQKWSSK